LTIAAATDDRTPANLLRYEVCWGPSPGSCSGAGFVVRATFNAAGTQVADVSSRDGTTQHFAARAVDLSGNASTPTQTRSAAIPAFLSWAAGSVTLTKTGQPGSYSVAWPAVSSSCPSRGPLEVTATCTGATCSCTVAGNLQSATCTATTCDQVSVAVRARAGSGSQTRSASYRVRFSEVSPIFDTYGCRTCHGNFGYPTFTIADVNTATMRCPTQVYVAPGNTAASTIWTVATQQMFLCAPTTHLDFGALTTAHTNLLRCWIEDGAAP
jgi:hypothetical protein